MRCNSFFSQAHTAVLTGFQSLSILFLMGSTLRALSGETSTRFAVKRMTLESGEVWSVSNAPSLDLKGAGARQQLLATAECSDGLSRDLTRAVTWEVGSSAVAKVSSQGLLTPVADGETEVTARSADGVVSHLKVTVSEAKVSQPINFPNQIVPIFTKLGCNGGGCHGKSGGQNGFRLSLLGFEPTEDYEYLVKESRGRRLFPSAPDHSLLLQKAVGILPHGGGKRMEPDSRDYQLIRRWISQGMPYGRPGDPTVERIDVYPRGRTLDREGEQQLTVKATYTDGSTEDVTAGSQYDSNDKDTVQVDANGKVKVVGRSEIGRASCRERV